MEGEMDVWIHLGVFIIKSEVLKQIGVTTWLFWKRKLHAYKEKIGATKIMDHCTL